MTDHRDPHPQTRILVPAGVAPTVNSAELTSSIRTSSAEIDSRRNRSSHDTSRIREGVDEQMRRQLARVFCLLTQDSPLADLEEFTEVHRSRISRLRNGKLTEFSIPWLLRVIASMRYCFFLSVTPTPPATITPNRSTAIVALYDRFGRELPIVSTE